MDNKRYQWRLLPSEIFRAYDIRGLVEQQLDENAYYVIGRSLSQQLHQLGRSQILLARDGRLNSETFAIALAQGLLESGVEVIDLGAISTPMLYYATCVYSEVDSGLMVTGSHNPAEYNGLKIVLAGMTLGQEDIQQLYQLTKTEPKEHAVGTYQRFDITDHYIGRILSDIKLHRPLRVVVDCGNGIGGPIVPTILRQLSCEVIELYCDIDGRFPHHHPDPTVESNLQDLKTAITQNQAHLGLAFDGDADRLGVVTEKGELIWPDRLMMLYAQDILKRHPTATIVYDVKCSQHLTKFIENAGGIAKMCPTGHSIVKRVMKQELALLAGEMSGHLFFKDRWYGFDDALYSACRLLEILSASSQTVSQQFAVIPNSINTPEIKIPIAEEEKFTFMQRFVQEASFPEAQVITIDGIRVEFAEGWGLLRASNTTPCLVARFEAIDYFSLSAIQTQFKQQLLAMNEQLLIPF